MYHSSLPRYICCAQCHSSVCLIPYVTWANSEATASITLPGMLLSGTDLNRNARIVYFVYLSDGLFLMRTSYTERPYTRVGSILLGANVGNTSQSDLDQPVQLKFLKNPVSMKLHTIVYQ